MVCQSPTAFPIRTRRFLKTGHTIRRLQLLATIVCGIALTYLLLAPSPLSIFGTEGVAAEESVDRSISGFLQHVFAYGVFSWMVLSVFAVRGEWLRGFSLVMAHALVTEAAQAFIPSRHADAWDIAANVSGIVLGALLHAATGRVVPVPADEIPDQVRLEVEN